VPEVLSVPRVVAERVRREAEKLGVSVEEYLLELVSRGLDPESKAREYVETALELLEQGREELEKGNVRQAAEKTWGSAALAVKAHAYWREGKRLASHGELWEYVDRVAEELGDWARDSWYAASSMHTCFYEGWCTARQVERAIESVSRLVKTIAEKIRGRE